MHVEMHQSFRDPSLHLLKTMLAQGQGGFNTGLGRPGPPFFETWTTMSSDQLAQDLATDSNPDPELALGRAQSPLSSALCSYHCTTLAPCGPISAITNPCKEGKPAGPYWQDFAEDRLFCPFKTGSLLHPAISVYAGNTAFSDGPLR